MEVEEVAKIMELMVQHQLTEFHLGKKNNQLFIKKGNQEEVVFYPSIRTLSSFDNNNPGTVAAERKIESEKSHSHDKTIMSTLVGYFYYKKMRNNKGLIRVGDFIKAGRTFGFIVAMNVNNEIKADRDGIVIDILANNGDAVEYGTPLIVIREHKKT